MVRFYYIDERINQLLTGCMVYPSLHVNKMFREKVENIKDCISSKYNGNYKRCYEK